MSSAVSCTISSKYSCISQFLPKFSVRPFLNLSSYNLLLDASSSVAPYGLLQIKKYHCIKLTALLCLASICSSRMFSVIYHKNVMQANTLGCPEGKGENTCRGEFSGPPSLRGCSEPQFTSVNYHNIYRKQ